MAKKQSKKMTNKAKVVKYAKGLGVRLPHGYETVKRKRK